MDYLKMVREAAADRLKAHAIVKLGVKRILKKGEHDLYHKYWKVAFHHNDIEFRLLDVKLSVYTGGPDQSEDVEIKMFYTASSTLPKEKAESVEKAKAYFAKEKHLPIAKHKPKLWYTFIYEATLEEIARGGVSLEVDNTNLN